MDGRVAFLIGTGGGAYDALAEALAAHPDVLVTRDSHVLTSLAYLGYYDKVHKASYDHVLAAEAQRLFVEQLPGREADYVDACRVYCDSLYGRALSGAGRRLLVDVTPSYLAILPFLRRVLPEAPCVVVTRHPLDMLSAGLSATEATRTLRAMAAFIGRSGRARIVREPDWRADPEGVHAEVCGFLEVGTESARFDRAETSPDATPARRLEDVRRIVRGLTAEELAACGYRLEEIWAPFDAALGRRVRRVAPSRIHGARRKAVERLRRLARRPSQINRILSQARLACDVLLRR